MEWVDQLKNKYKTGDVSIKIIFVCTGLFLISSLINFIFYAQNPIKFQDFFALNSNFNLYLQKAWGIITYMVFHANIIHLLMNCLMLFVVGKLFLRYFRDQDMITFFVYGGIAGGLFYMAVAHLIGNQFWSLTGASASIYAIFFGLVAYIPKTNVQLALINLNVPLQKIGVFLVILDLVMIAFGNNVGGNISHLGGALFGFFYMKQFEKGNDFLGDFWRKFFSSKPKLKKEKNQYSRPQPPKDDYEFNAQKVENQKRIDKILEKISRSGYDSLTKDEKDFLFKSGK